MAAIGLDELKQLVRDNCMVQSGLDAIDEETPLFGPDGLGLDSIDALQLTVAIEKKYGATLRDPETARQVLRTLGSLRHWLERQGSEA